jgi:hypothetical protein
MAENTPKKEKRDFKQEFLEMVEKQSGGGMNGLHNAITMEESLKKDSAQLDEAHGQGMTSKDILGTLIKSKPASSPFGFGGMSQENGQVTEQQPGILAALLSTLITGNPKTSANLDMAKLLDAQKLQGGEEDSVVQESFALNNEIKRRQLAEMDSTGTVPTKEELMAGIPEGEQEDYLIKPIKQTIRGIVKTVPLLERKKTLPANQLADLGAFDNTRQDLNAVVDRLKTSGLQLGPGFSTRPGAIADMLGQMKGSEFASMKADIGRNFQLYRKSTTGVAAGYPELNMLAPNYPKATDTNDVFIQKSIDVMKDIDRNREILLDHYNNGGYAVSKLKGMSKQSGNYVKTGRNKQGQRVGMLADGSVEVINE